MFFLTEERVGEAWECSEIIAIPETEHWNTGTFFIHALLRREDLTSQRFHNTTANLVLFLNTEKDLN